LSKSILLKTEKEIRIYTDPYRVKLMSIFKDYGPLTTKNVADMLSETSSKVNYHIKKLLSIQALELDHIEVVNGINAKYYRPTNNSFRIDYTQNNRISTEILDPTINMFIQIIDTYKSKIYRLSEQEPCEENSTSKIHSSFLTNKNIYLTEDNFQEFEEAIIDLMAKYCEKTANSHKYSMIASFVMHNEPK